MAPLLSMCIWSNFWATFRRKAIHLPQRRLVPLLWEFQVRLQNDVCVPPVFKLGVATFMEAPYMSRVHCFASLNEQAFSTTLNRTYIQFSSSFSYSVCPREGWAQRRHQVRGFCLGVFVQDSSKSCLICKKSKDLLQFKIYLHQTGFQRNFFECFCRILLCE